MFSDFEDEKLEEKEQEPGTPKPTRLAAFWIAVALLPVVMFFDHIGKFELGINIFLCLFVNIFVVIVRWKLRKHAWFWAVMVVVLALELPIVLKVHWPDRWVPAVELLPIGIAGALVALGAISLAEKLFLKDPPDEG